VAEPGDAPAPGPLIGTGRAADVYDIGGGKVLRRYRSDPRPGVVEREAAAMRHLRANGYPVPEVFEAAGRDVVMERLVGTTMLDDLEAHPWRVDRHADTWADMHRRLGDVPVGDLAAAGLPTRFGAPDAVVHLDFHPDNIMLTADGPVVFDWTNAALGPPAADVAFAWVIGATTTVDGSRWLRAVVNALRHRLVDRFVDSCGRAGALALLPDVAAYRVQDRNVRPEEAARVHALVAQLTSR
jgi:aminoglycoside phosphotransferase (APT) family kinase protein